MKREIENKMIDLMKAETALADVVAFMRGTAGELPASYFPHVAILIQGEDPGGRLTGNFKRGTLIGEIAVHVLLQDVPIIVDREVTMPSYEATQDLADPIVDMFNDEDNNTLGNLTGSDGRKSWAVTGFQLITPIVYGFAVWGQQRPDLFTNYARISFSVDVQVNHT